MLGRYPAYPEVGFYSNFAQKQKGCQRLSITEFLS